MISDETFPMIDEYFEEDYTVTTSGDTLGSSETFETSGNSSGVGASTDISSNPNTGDSTKQSDFFESEFSFATFSSANKLTLEAPQRAPTKQKKSHSCLDLQQRRPASLNYDHVESKVKKLIERNRSSLGSAEERRSKILSRHKSMILHSPPSIDDIYPDDPATLIRELRKKSVRIYELQEMNDEKDQRIYSLEYERSKMRLTFDKLRVEMHDLKNKARESQQVSVTSHLKMLKNTYTQTDTPSIDSSFIRELNFNSDTTVPFNQTHFSELNNASSDNLIPDVTLEDINVTRTVEIPQDTEDPQEEPKKKKKFCLFKLISCVTK